uniref:Transmembrane protein n=1 Tax=Ascaris suum TaxID=6253 RepID=F1L579_ASCSU
MRIVLWIRNFFYQLCLISIVILILALSRSLLPTLSGIEDIFPSNISRHFNAAEFNSWRIQRANFTLEHISKSFNLTNEDNQVISIIIIASGREGYFLTQVIAAFIEILQTSNLYASISICNVSTVENEEIDRLSHIVPIIKPIKQFAYNFNKYEERLMKESNDYWFCMNATHNSRYTLLIEDDALPVPAFDLLMRSVVDRMDNDQRLDFIKLYHPGHLRKIPYYFQVSIICLLISLLLTFAIWRHIAWLPLLLTFAFFVYHFDVYYTYQFFADIRYALTGSIYIAMSESCCTPAVIYRTSKIPKMLDYFTMRAFTNRSAKDDILDEAPFISRLTDTNLVIHIGYISAIRRRAVTLDVLKQLRYRSQHTFPF